MNNIDIAKGMNGMSIIGSLISDTEKNISAIPFALAGDLDEQFYRGFHLMEYGTKADYVENDQRILQLVTRTKDILRSFVQDVFDAAAREDAAERRRNLEALRVQLRQSNKPHAQGTVAEIATKLGISKSEVRRRKAEGTLDELFTK